MLGLKLNYVSQRGPWRVLTRVVDVFHLLVPRNCWNKNGEKSIVNIFMPVIKMYGSFIQNNTKLPLDFLLHKNAHMDPACISCNLMYFVWVLFYIILLSYNFIIVQISIIISHVILTNLLNSNEYIIIYSTYVISLMNGIVKMLNTNLLNGTVDLWPILINGNQSRLQQICRHEMHHVFR